MVVQIDNCSAHLKERFSEEINKTDDQQPFDQVLLEMESNADEYRAVFPSKEELLREGPRGIQYKLAKIMARLSNKSYINRHQNSIDDVARKHSASSEGSVLITTIPTYSTITFPSDGEAMRLLLATRLGLPIPNLDEGPCNCKWKGRQGHIDKFGLHTFVHCRLHQSKHNVHDNIKAEIMTFLTKAGHRPKPERSTSLQEVDPNTKKRTDITYQYNASTYCDIDITVTDFRTERASSKKLQATPGNPSNLAERRKIVQYKDKLPKIMVTSFMLTLWKIEDDGEKLCEGNSKNISKLSKEIRNVSKIPRLKKVGLHELRWLCSLQRDNTMPRNFIHYLRYSQPS